VVNMSELASRYRGFLGAVGPRWVVRAPGRVNLIGEHVDYNDGYVLPIAMSQAVYVLTGPADDGRIGVHSTAMEQEGIFPADEPGPPGEPAWGNYVRGVAEMLRRRGIKLRAGRLVIHSEVPVGGGVSSSAALEVGVGLAWLALAGETGEPTERALLARQAEHEYAGSPCGIMDQFICVLGRAGHALLLDCRSRECRHLPMELGERVFVVMNTQVRHSIAGGEYAVRQKQCQEGLAVLRAVRPSVQALRDVSMEQLAAVEDRLDGVVFRRCRHVVSEIERTRAAADALAAGQAEAFGELMIASHASLRDDYEVSCTELDVLVDVAERTPGCYGARMTGGGFGGCAIALVDREAEDGLRAAIREGYDRRFEKPAIVYTTAASDGARVREL